MFVLGKEYQRYCHQQCEYGEWRFKEITEKQLEAMRTIVHYLPHLLNEAEQCSNRGEASDFIDAYMTESYEARDKVLGR